MKNKTEPCPHCGFISITDEKIGNEIVCKNNVKRCLGYAKVTEPLDMDQVNHPPHYKTHPSGIECIQITEHMDFLKGNAMKYIWRAGNKGSEIEDLEKAQWYLDRRITMLRKKPAATEPLVTGSTVS